MSQLNRIGSYWRLALGLKGFLNEPLTLEQSQQIIKQGLENRERNLLLMVKRAIYDNECSPYLELLKLVGCEYADFERMVRSEGIEGTLHNLRREGVYLSCEEFKGKQDIARAGKVFRFRESDFNNPFLSANLEFRTAASRSSGTRVLMSLDRYHYYGACNSVAYAAHGIWRSPVVLWLPIFPSGAWLVTMLRLAKMGNPPIRWFSQLNAGTAKPPLVKRLATYYIVYAGRLFGTAFPKPEYVSLDHACEVAEYMVEVLKRGQGCVLETYANSAIRVCQVAREKKLDISGATFVTAGEPLTEAKHREITAAGCSTLNMYGISDMGMAGFGCAKALISDDVHQFMDSMVIIQRRRRAPFGGAELDAFLFTSLLPKTAKILLNVESGDYGVIENRRCGCPLEELGLTKHINQIRGFDKMTGEGMTFIGTDLLRIIEEVLPAKFGGASTDYQIVEEEDEAGLTRIAVLVSPEVGEIDENGLVQIILTELNAGKDTQRLMTRIWSDGNVLRVKRQRPLTTGYGKLFPLHIHKGDLFGVSKNGTDLANKTRETLEG